MIKKLILAALIALPMSAAAQTIKLGHFRSSDVLQGMAEFTQAQNEMNKQSKMHDDEYKRITTEYQKTLEDFVNAQDSLPQNIAERRQKELQDMAQKVQEYAQFADQDLSQLQKKLMEPIILKINEAVKAVGDAQGMTYIFDLNSTSIPYVNDKVSVDLTNEIKAKVGAQ
ncbi:MAG: OmpH family outer membrane protein [Bacteroidaceae bacterium]|jgi:outer membrane protein